MTNSTVDAMNSFTCPKRRVSQPVSGSEMALATPKEVITQVPWSGDTPRSPAMAGIDTLAIDVSSTFMKVASDSASVPIASVAPVSGGNPAGARRGPPGPRRGPPGRRSVSCGCLGHQRPSPAHARCGSGEQVATFATLARARVRPQVHERRLVRADDGAHPGIGQRLARIEYIRRPAG